MIKDYGNQIVDNLIKYIPYTQNDIGLKYPVIDFSIIGNNMQLELEPLDYSAILPILNDITKNVFSVTNIHLKNNIISFVYDRNTTLFIVKFTKPHNKKGGDSINLKAFTNTNYNTSYEVFDIIDDKILRLQNVIVPQASVLSGLGFTSIEYLGGLNNLYSLIDLTNNVVAFTINSQYFSTLDINDIDIDYKPTIHYLYDKIICCDLVNYNLNNVIQSSFVIIDTKSLTISPSRSKNNQTDSNYNIYGASGQLSRNYSLDIYYIIDEETNSSNYIIYQQNFDKILVSILNNIKIITQNGITTRLTVQSVNFANTQSIFEGRTAFVYNIGWMATYINDDILLPIEDVSYPINIINFNNNEIDATKF